MKNEANILYQKAMEYASRGYSILPLGKDKRPLLASWKQYQQTAADDVQIEKWWDTWPEANVGIITGKISNLTVVDIDTSGDKTVPINKFPPTLTMGTPSGGYHLYYLYDAAIQQTANTFPQFPHVDIRNDGGYVVAPPSKAEYTKEGKKIKGTYKVLKQLNIAPFPTKLFVKQTTAQPSVTSLLKGFPDMAGGDGRNVALTKIIGKILRVTREVGVAWELALTANARFKKPLEEKEVEVIFNSIKAKENEKPLSGVEFITTEKGAIIANVENVYLTLEADANISSKLRLNTFSGAIETNYNNDKWEPFQRNDVISIRSYLMRTYPHFTKIGHTEVEDAMVRLAHHNKVSPPATWLESLVWDKQARLDTWLTQTYGVPSDAYHTAVGANWLKGLVKRLIIPGCKFDYVLVLEGKQGIRKSTSLAVLGGDWHVETVFAPDNKDFFMLFAGNAIVEFSEGETLSRTDAKKLKAVITMQHDKYRPPYERSAKDFPRQCVFAMTTNQEQYLKDETGNRRWLPISIEQLVNIDWLKENREQLFAEAYYRVIVKSETVYEFPEEETLYQQSLRQTNDPREEVIANWYYNVLDDKRRAKGITTRMAYIEAIQGLDQISSTFAKQLDRSEEMVIAGILKESLKLKKHRERLNGVRYYLFLPTPESEQNKTQEVDIKEKVKQMDF